MAHKCFISFKKEDMYYKDKLIEKFDKSDVIDKTLDKTINSNDGDYIMSVIRSEYLKDSTVTIFLIGEHSSENEGRDYLGDKNYFIQKELQATLYNGKDNSRSGLIGVVLPNMYEKVYKGNYQCTQCQGNHNYVNINDDTAIREFSRNYYVAPHNGCAWTPDERYAILVKWDDFYNNPEKYIEEAFNKRSDPIANKIRIYNLR
ncbi:MAG: TIR domain-containing protein [Clostridia bacterium]|nr:TIR domain-containing protein [Clostridia bacterium]